jgi:REP element-mobilizing transposase RayT
MSQQRFRKNVRIPKFDYSGNGSYFVTVCTALFRKRLRGDYIGMVDHELGALQERFPGVKIDTRVIMDDHIHVIIGMQNCQAPLSEIVGGLKSLTTRKAKGMGFVGKRFWQPNYYEHVIKNDDEYCKIIQYVIHNPAVREMKMEEVRQYRSPKTAD